MKIQSVAFTWSCQQTDRKTNRKRNLLGESKKNIWHFCYYMACLCRQKNQW